MRYRIIILPRAKRDARDIDEYLAARNPDAADRFSHNLQETLERQASLRTPGMPWLSNNSKTAELRWTRVKGFSNYLIFLRVIDEDLEVVRVLHGAGDIEALLSE